ncbi:hypothetical protein HMPREF0860_1489 [Treponema socranskii subsp. socranskii VPI DR56BR1116 = ATCC 35536]|uniref:Lipoprotein n=1 Tax=Treponema socranskii subsp. socranskii VPI DR56BR1116 = ATCC 35536 TaxID=1125725 RepID=A0ABN0P5V3_TRESO|nr:hypothetical protein HMPREF0860_1489 [Treponema socranskii subsp. socranskii VPI DR56BR1116 = ATCC 35536]
MKVCGFLTDCRRKERQHTFMRITVLHCYFSIIELLLKTG